MRIKNAAVVLVLLCAATATHGQETTGVILGYVRDPSGAVIRRATITITEHATRLVRTLTSKEDGAYMAPLLTPGVYRVEVEQPGFQKAARDNVRVSVTERVVVNFTLSIGPIEQEALVVDVAPLVQANSATTGRVIAGETLRALPLSTRNFTQLLALTAGSSIALNNADRIGIGNVSPNVNGLRPGSNNYLMDGLFSTNSLNNSPTLIASPALDFIEEFKVLTSLSGAEYGKQAGAVVTLVTRSGSNDIHGSAWEYMRDTGLNARNFFATERRRNDQDQFGATLGGPVVLPGLYRGRERSFFFVGYEGLRQQNSNAAEALSRLSLPTVSMRAGVFPSRLRDPLLGLPCTATDASGCFPGNIIPASRIHPTSRAILEQLIPRPNTDTGGPINYVRSGHLQGESDQFIARLDHAFSAKDRLSARFFDSRGSTITPGAIENFDTQARQIKSNLMLSEMHVFSPSLINELRLGWDRSVSIGGDARLNTTDARSLGIPQTNDLPGFPLVSISGVLSFGRNQDFRDDVNLFTLSDTVTWLRGRHSLKLGAEARHARMRPYNALRNRPQWVFNGQSTGNAFADFLLDLPSQGTYAVGPGIQNLRASAFNVFVADDFKVNTRLTLNFGLRYELNRSPHDAVRPLVSFWPERYQGVGSPERAGLVVGGQDGVPGSTVFDPNNLFGPRVGFAYSLDKSGKTVLRGGFGIFFDQPVGQMTQDLRVNPPVLAQRQITFPVTGVADGYVYRTEGLDPNALPVPTATSSFATAGMQRDQKTGSAQQWNFGVQRQLPGDVVVEAAYVGTHGVHLILGRNINFPAPNPSGVFVRPYAGFAAIRYLGNDGNSIYHSGQFTLQKRFSGGSQLLFAYTFSKTIDDAADTNRFITSAIGNPYDRRSNRGPAAFDRPHRLNLSFNLALPNPFQRRLEAIFGGWEISGIAVYQSGTSFDVMNNQSGLDWEGDLGSPGRGGRADFLGGNPYTSGSTRDRLIGWLNAAAFARAPRNRFGTLGRNALRGPSHYNVDAALAKRFSLRGSLKLALRVEAFNLLNHANFSNPNGNLDSSSFGVISSTVANARIIQLGLKLSF